MEKNSHLSLLIKKYLDRYLKSLKKNADLPDDILNRLANLHLKTHNLSIKLINQIIETNAICHPVVLHRLEKGLKMSRKMIISAYVKDEKGIKNLSGFKAALDYMIENEISFRNIEEEIGYKGAIKRVLKGTYSNASIASKVNEYFGFHFF